MHWRFSTYKRERERERFLGRGDWQLSHLTLICSARLLNATIMLPGLLIFFKTRTVWAKRVGEYDRPSLGTVAQKFASSLKQRRGLKVDAEAPCKQASFPFGTPGHFSFPILIPFLHFPSLLLGEIKSPVQTCPICNILASEAWWEIAPAYLHYHFSFSEGTLFCQILWWWAFF